MTIGSGIYNSRNLIGVFGISPGEPRPESTTVEILQVYSGTSESYGWDESTTVEILQVYSGRSSVIQCSDLQQQKSYRCIRVSRTHRKLKIYNSRNLIGVFGVPHLKRGVISTTVEILQVYSGFYFLRGRKHLQQQKSYRCIRDFFIQIDCDIYNSRNLIGVFGPLWVHISVIIYNSRNLIGVFGFSTNLKHLLIYNSRNLIGVFGIFVYEKSVVIYNSRNLIGVFGAYIILTDLNLQQQKSYRCIRVAREDMTRSIYNSRNLIGVFGSSRPMKVSKSTTVEILQVYSGQESRITC